ncbi:MAG: SurA N-terminal domain-containing protein [Spirochaetes bacterium]|nr:SurA N-terminal domain-containing protein [Spirochaetota bacterium]
MKKLIILFLFIFLTLTPGYAEIVNGIACKVGDSIITINEFETAYESEKVRAGFFGEGVPDKSSVMDLLIDNLLVKMETEKKGIVVTEEELNEIIDNIRKQNKLSIEEFQRELKRENITLNELKENYKNDILKMRLISQMVSQRINNISNEEIKRFYEDPANKKLFTIPAIVGISQIYIPVPSDLSYKEAKDIKTHTMEIYEQASGGADFQELLMMYSRAPNKEESGGTLGSFTREQLLSTMKPQDVDLIFSLQKGDVATPIMIRDGYYIFKIDDRKEEKLLSFEEAYENIKSYLLKEEGEEIFEEWLFKRRQIITVHYMIPME